MTTSGPLCALFGSAGEPPSPTELAWYRDLLPADAGTLIEPMCGYGRLLVPLVESGFCVHGVDASAAMLAECESRLARAACTTTLFRQDVAELNVPFRYAAAFIGGGAFQRLIDAERARTALARIRAHLVEPGLLLLDLHVPAESAQRIAAPLVEVRSAVLHDGSRIAQRSETTMYPEARLARTQSRYVHRRGHDLLREETESFALTWYEPEDIMALVQCAGFRDVVVGASAGTAADGRAFSIRARA
ncbi:MAG TPA: class I SAM-dependent methyltransferase [Casimicrobiaceae bacterium]|nr:class I SAM-dependent methyltransferase [Casimicrobiaceae bacterium]